MNKNKYLNNYIFICLLLSQVACQAITQLNKNIGAVDVQRKMQLAETLVNEAATYFQRTKNSTACRDFRKSLSWRIGELNIFVFTDAGTCLVHGDDTDIIWKNFKDYKTPEDKSLISEMLLKGEKGGWMSYNWNNGFMYAFVKVVNKSNKKYIIGTGFFPERRDFTVEQLVKSAVSNFNDHGKKESFDLISNQVGPFVKGDVYLFAYDFDGNNVAHGENIAYIGQNLLGLVDSDGAPIIKKMIEIAKNPEGAGWLDYTWAGIPKRGYVQRVVDPKTKTPYFIGAGYYPTVDEDYVKSFVGGAIKYLKTNGADTAFKAFNNVVGQFAVGGLRIQVYELDGKNVANGDNPGFVGQNLIKRKDSEGREIVAMMIAEANKNGRGWISYLNNNAYEQTYFEKVEVPDGIYIVSSGFFPSSKQQSVKALVEKAVISLKSSVNYEAFREFTSRDTDFFRGDLRIFAYDNQGVCYANGDNTSVIWKNFKTGKDIVGKRVLDNIIITASSGGGWIEYKVNNASRRVFVKSVEKKIEGQDSKTFVLGCGYYL